MTRDSDRSVCFDAAAAYYDATRSGPAEGRERAFELILAEVTGRGRCLDVGVGTGRVALPLAGAGIDLVGNDVSLSMMHQVRAKVGGVVSFPLVGGDATALPFRDAVFGTALIIRVLHSVPRRQRVIQEAFAGFGKVGSVAVTWRARSVLTFR